MQAAYPYFQTGVVHTEMKKRTTKHFSGEEWVDFVMEQASPTQKAEMRSHLDSGCEKCSELHALWTRVGEVAKRGAAQEPPDSAVRHVRGVFSMLAETQNAKRRVVIPRLVFDTLWQPALAGVRSSAPSPRQMIYKSKEISIEMHVEAENRSERINLTGQISIGSLEGQTLPPIPVVLSGKKGQVAATATNGFGEFHLAYTPEDNLRISFVVPGGEEIVIPVGGPGARIYFHR